MSAKILVVDDIAPNVKLLEAKLTREFFPRDYRDERRRSP
jgi:hypothetical protein